MDRRHVPLLILGLGLAGGLWFLLRRPAGTPPPVAAASAPADLVAVHEGLPAPGPIWPELLAAVRSGKDREARHFLSWLAREEAAPERGAAVAATLDAWLEGRQAGLLPVLRAYSGPTAEALSTRLEARSLPALDLVSLLFFPGGQRDEAAWRTERFVAALLRLCERSGDLERDLETGPARAKALWIAGRARLKEAVPAIKRAAGLARDAEGHRLEADPHGSVMAVARKIVEANRPPPGR